MWFISDSEDDGDCKPGNLKQRQSQADDAKQEMKKSSPERTGNTKRQNTSDESSDEEMNESEESRNTSNSPDEAVKMKANTLKNEEMRSGSPSAGKKSAECDQESDSDKSDKSDNINRSESSDNEKGDCANYSYTVCAYIYLFGVFSNACSALVSPSRKCLGRKEK